MGACYYQGVADGTNKMPRLGRASGEGGVEAAQRGRLRCVLTIDRRLTAVVSSPTFMSTDPLLHSCRSAHTTFFHRRAVRPAMFIYILRLLAEEEL